MYFATKLVPMNCIILAAGLIAAATPAYAETEYEIARQAVTAANQACVSRGFNPPPIPFDPPATERAACVEGLQAMNRIVITVAEPEWQQVSSV